MSRTPTRDRPSRRAATRSTDRVQGRGARVWLRDIAIGTAVAILGAIGAKLVGVVPDLFGSAEPQGNLIITQTLPDQTLRMFRREAAEGRPDEERGFVLVIERQGAHVPRNGCELRWTYQDADGPRDVQDLSLVEQPANHVAQDRHSCVTNTRVWVPLPGRLQGYERIAVKLELLVDDHVIGSDVTDPFTLG